MQMQAIEAQIWNYLDGTATASEITFVEQMIVSDLNWKQKYQELAELNRHLVSGIEQDQPSLRFSKNVMEQIGDIQPFPATSNYINKKIICGIAAIFVFTIIAFLVYSFTQTNWASPNLISPVPFEIKNGYTDRIHFDKLADSKWINMALMVNIVLGLLLLDSAFRRRRKATHPYN